MNTNPRTLINAYRTLQDARRPLVLATVIETFGSTYRKAGARMLITESGEFHGIIGGGCFEGDLLERAQQVFADGQPALHFYDMRAEEDELWGLGLGCNGAVRLLLERIDILQDAGPLSILQRCLEQRNRGVLATVCASDNPDYPAGKHFFVRENTFIQDDLPGWLLTGIRQVRETKLPVLAMHTPGHETVTVFYDWIQPPPHLLIIGAGPDAIPLTGLAHSMDWEVTVVDHREAYADRNKFFTADQVLAVKPEALMDHVELDSVDAAVLMTHNINYDERFLKILAETNIGHIAMLGPVSRRDRLLKKSGNLSALLEGRVTGPAGLDIGARLPEEIALSIMAELVARYRRNHVLMVQPEVMRECAVAG